MLSLTVWIPMRKRLNQALSKMTQLTSHAARSVAGTLRDALSESANDLEAETPVDGHSHRMTLMIIAGAFFLVGFLWAKSRAQNF